ncbi:MAG: hypothetical protein KGR26_06240 [Cyanobacteria bacterium REEB65]|nr:hypothetical protein [Cyanobacteria bacterium REEB65]
MNPLTRNILLGGAIAVVIALAAGFFAWDWPLEQQLSQLRQEVASAKSDKLVQESNFRSLEASNEAIRQQFDQLALYDLRNEDKPISVEDARSNSLLTQVLDIFQNASISVDKLDPAQPGVRPIADDPKSPPLAIVSQRNYQLEASGLYRDWLIALSQLERLPPTITIRHYKVAYQDRAPGDRAMVDVTLDLAFNFLVKPPQSAPGSSGGKGNALQQFMDELSNAHSALPVLDRAIASIASWLVPPAEARTRPGPHRHKGRRRRYTPSPAALHRGGSREIWRVTVRSATGFLRRVPTRSWLQADVRRVHVRPAGAIVLDPELAPMSAAAGGHAASPLGSLQSSFRDLSTALVGGAGPAGAGESSLASAPPASASPDDPAGGLLLTLPIAKSDVPIGRAEPFLPLIDTSADAGPEHEQAALLAAPAPSTERLVAPLPRMADALVATPRPLDISLVGLLTIGNESAALVQVDGRTLRVGRGSLVAPGYTVQALGRDSILLETPFGRERKELRRSWTQPDTPHPVPAAGRSKASLSGQAGLGSGPVPGLPALSGM